jgi:hypothetical protein
MTDRSDPTRPDPRPTEEEPVIELGNEFAEVRVRKLHTRNGTRLVIEAPRSGRAVALCPLELEALTWQTGEVFSAMVGNPYGPLELDRDG